MKVRAIALGEQRSNAIGTVELECAPYGLVIAYLGVGSFSEGYAPGALTRGTLVTVPYTAIRQARFEGERLLLEIDPDLTPHYKLVLGGFTISDGTHRHELYRQRLVLRTGAFRFALVRCVKTGKGGQGAVNQALALRIKQLRAQTVLFALIFKPQLRRSRALLLIHSDQLFAEIT